MEISGGEKRTDGGLAVKESDRNAEVAAAAEGIEDFLVAEVGETMEATLLAEGNLLGERRGDAGRKRVGHATLLAHREGRAALEIDRAAKGVSAFVRSMTLDKLYLVEHRPGDIVYEDRAAEAALASHQPAVHRHRVEAPRHAADSKTREVAAGIELAVDAG